jgi:hypothetical protein
MASSKKACEKNHVKDPHAIQTKAGNLIFQEDVSIDSTVGLVKESSYTEWNHAGGGFIKMLNAGTVISSSGDMSIRSDGEVRITAKGNKQEVITGDNRIYTHGNNVVLEGKQDREQRDAAKKIAQIQEKIETAKQNAIKSTKGDEVECPTCAETYLVNRKSDFGQKLFKTIRKFTPPYFAFAIDILQTLYNFLIAPMLDEVSGQSILGGTCGNKGCKNGKIESPQKKIEAGNKAAEETYKSNQEQIEKLANILKSSGKVYSLNGNMTLSIGLPDMDHGKSPYVKAGVHPLSFKHGDPKSGTIFARSGEGGSIDIILNTNPTPPINGNATLNVVGKLLVNTGNCGMDFLTRGQAHIAAGDIKIVATEGEALLSSGNLTVIKGKGVKIDADDGSGTGGIILGAKNTRVGGSLHVDGNFTTLGSISIDGNLSTPYLITRSMRLQTTKGATPKLINNSANWVGTCQAMEAADKTLQLLSKYIMPGYLDVEGIFTLTYETFNTIWQATTLEWPVPTGIFAGVCAGIGGGVCTGYVWNFKHSHNSVPQSHTHDHTVPFGKYLDDRGSWAGARTGASSVPIPANESGDGTVPGPKSNGGACGGGGYLYNSPNSKASKARRERNRSFGIDSDDAFGDYDFVNVTPLSGYFGYDDNGNIIPEDKVKFSIGIECPPEVYKKVETNENGIKCD